MDVEEGGKEVDGGAEGIKEASSGEGGGGG